ncbi:MAG: acetylglutamate kinase, partial [Candidatus Obscuribacterales bacterium]|nr:acetylglutamate kinase [Candidatus Obscuribacterales bacterium]
MKNTLVLIKLGGSVLKNPELLSSFAKQIKLLQEQNTAIVIVHGAGPAIDQKLAESNIKSSKVLGLRVTDAATLAVVKEQLCIINESIVSSLSAQGSSAISFSPEHESVFAAEKYQVEIAAGPIDLGFVGKIQAVDADKIKKFLNQNSIPVVAPLAFDKTGLLYNINADSAALALAAAISVNKMINVTDVPGLLEDLNDSNSVIRKLSLSQAESLIENGKIGGGMLPKLESCVEAVKAGVNSVQIINGKTPNSLLDAMNESDSGGTEIYKDL